jgi:predicted ester cyclase
MTSPTDALVRSFYEIVAAGDEAGLSRLLHPSWEMLPMAYPSQPEGPSGYAPLMKGFNAAFPDGRFIIHEVIAAHPKYTVRTTAHGTHKGTFLGREASGRAIAFNTIDVHEVEGDVIRRSWHIEDFASFFRQVDVQE